MNAGLRFGILCCLLSAASIANAGVISITIGDNDGFGFGVPDNGTGVTWPGTGNSGSLYDGRSAAEAAASDGSQFTDSYAALRPAVGPSTTTVGDVIFDLPVGELLLSGNLTVDMGDFQAAQFGAPSVFFNGVLQPDLFNFQDGFMNTVVRSFALDTTAIANANAAGRFVVTVDNNNSVDFYAFDYFQLDGETAAVGTVPEPASLAIFGALGMAGFAARRKRKQNA